MKWKDKLSYGALTRFLDCTHIKLLKMYSSKNYNNYSTDASGISVPEVIKDYIGELMEIKSICIKKGIIIFNTAIGDIPLGAVDDETWEPISKKIKDNKNFFKNENEIDWSGWD